MKNEIISTDFCTLDSPCSYLPDRYVRTYYSYVENATFEFVSGVIKRGWRRFGKYFFYPICQGCSECKSLRIDVDNFLLSRSQKRVIKRNENTKILLRQPTISSAHINLYNRYHAWKAKKDGWKYRDINYKDYYENFVEGAWDFGYEVLYFQDERLIGVDLIDILEDGISAIYFFYEPDYAKLSLGIYSLLYQIALAKEMGLSYIYLGYWVNGCKAFKYKTNFKPEEILEGFPSLDEEANWRAFTDS